VPFQGLQSRERRGYVAAVRLAGWGWEEGKSLRTDGFSGSRNIIRSGGASDKRSYQRERTASTAWLKWTTRRFGDRT